MDITSYLLAKRYIDDVIQGVSLRGQSAYEIAVANGFEGSEVEWLESLVGSSPYIGENGHWFLNNQDTGVLASPDLSSYYAKADLVAMNTIDIMEICQPIIKRKEE